MKQKVYTFLSGGKIDTLDSFNAIPPTLGYSQPAPGNAAENIKTDNISVQIPKSIASNTGPTADNMSTDADTPDRPWGNDPLESGWYDQISEDPKKEAEVDLDPEEDEEDPGEDEEDPGEDEEDPEEDEEDDYFNIIIELLRKIDRNTRKRKTKKKKKKKHGGRRTKRKSRRRTKRSTKRRTKR